MWLNEVTNNVHLLLVQVLYNYKLRLDSDGNMLTVIVNVPLVKGHMHLVSTLPVWH